MHYTKPLLGLLLTAMLATPVYSAPEHGWGQSKKLASVEEKIELEKYQEAITELKTIIINEPDNADALNLLGYSSRKLKRYEIAENYYQRALENDPKHKGAMEYLGELYVETNRMDEAQKMLDRLDDACFFTCSEYKQLQAYIDNKSVSE